MNTIRPSSIIYLLTVLITVSSCISGKQDYKSAWANKNNRELHWHTTKQSSGLYKSIPKEQQASPISFSQTETSHPGQVAAVDDKGKIIESLSLRTSEKNTAAEAEIKESKKPAKVKGRQLMKEIKQSKGSGNSGRGIALMLVALALLGLGYIFYITLGVFGTILFIFFGIGAAVFFLVGLIMLLTSS